MKKFATLLALFCFLPCSAFCAVMMNNNGISVSNEIYTPMCMTGNILCAIGKYVMTSSTSKPLYVEGNMVCTSDKRICTNGYWVMYSNATRYM